MTDWIGQTFTSTAGWEHLETLVDIGDRQAGNAGERNAAEATRDALTAAGARDVHLDEFSIQGWTRGTSTVGTPDGDERCIALPRSPRGDETAQLVDLGYGLPEDFEDADIAGKVVMVSTNVPSWYERFPHRREKYYHAVEGGAAAFIFRNHVEGGLAPTGSVGMDAAPIGEIPAVGVSKEVGARLSRRFEGKDVTVSVEADIHDATSQNIHADLGPDTEQAVLITSHVDAHDICEGAMDNGAGTAMAVELAHALKTREDELDTRVHFLIFGAEEVGLVGASHAAKTMDHDGIKAILNNDGVVQGRDLKFYTHGFDELGAAVKTVSTRFDHPMTVTPRLGPHSDHWEFVQWGVPGYHVTAETGESGRGWGHTRADTLDKLEKRNFRESAILLTELAVHLASDDFTVAHKQPDEIATALEAENLDTALKLTGDWPY